MTQDKPPEWAVEGPANHRLLGVADVASIGASSAEDTGRLAWATGQSSSFLHAYVLSFGCQIWAEFDLDAPLHMPPFPMGSVEFASHLLMQMGEAAADGPGPSRPDGLAESLVSMSKLCETIREGGSSAVVGVETLFVGIRIGGLGRSGELNEQHGLAWAALQRSRIAEERRLQTMRSNKRAFEDKLLSFAQKQVIADPAVSNAAIQRRFRIQEKMPLATTSNRESKILSKLRRDGRLPERQP